jgi:hypothetical protein
VTPGEKEPTLDSEGVPDLEGPLPEKELTGDPQEGISPPADRPRASVDWGITAEEQRELEPLDLRVGRELPEVGAIDPVDEVAADLGLDGQPLDDSDEIIEAAGSLDDDVEVADLDGLELVGDDILADDEKDLVALAVPSDPDLGYSAEESAVHIIDEDDL